MFFCVHLSFAVILIGKRELVALLFFVFLVSRDCCVTLPHGVTGWLQLVIVVFSDHTHLLLSRTRVDNVKNVFHYVLYKNDQLSLN